MSRLPDFSKVDFRGCAQTGLTGKPADIQKWQKEFADQTGQTPDDSHWLTNKQIHVKPLNTAANGESLEHTI